MRYWLMKSEPDVYGIDDLKNMPGMTDHWDGVRNYQARNMMWKEMKRGDLAFFYHSNCKVPGIAGIMEIVREGYPDFTAFDPDDPHYDPKSDQGNPRWYMVDVCYRRTLRRFLALSDLKSCRELESLPLLRRGNRLSVMPVSLAQWKFILDLENKE